MFDFARLTAVAMTAALATAPVSHLATSGISYDEIDQMGAGNTLTLTGRFDVDAPSLLAAAKREPSPGTVATSGSDDTQRALGMFRLMQRPRLLHVSILGTKARVDDLLAGTAVIRDSDGLHTFYLDLSAKTYWAVEDQSDERIRALASKWERTSTTARTAIATLPPRSFDGVAAAGYQVETDDSSHPGSECPNPMRWRSTVRAVVYEDVSRPEPDAVAARAELVLQEEQFRVLQSHVQPTPVPSEVAAIEKALESAPTPTPSELNSRLACSTTFVSDALAPPRPGFILLRQVSTEMDSEIPEFGQSETTRHQSLTERAHLRTLGSDDAVLFEVPRDFMLVAGPSRRDGATYQVVHPL